MQLFYKSTIVFLGCLSSLSLFAQRKNIIGKNDNISIYPGYIVTASYNDTIYGDIYFQNPVYNESTLVFYKDGEAFTYQPEDGIISEYGFLYEKYNQTTKSKEVQWFTYIRKLVPKSATSAGFKEVFVERQIHDEICLYNYYELKTTKINSREYIHNYFVEKQGTQGFEILAITKENYLEMIERYLILGNNDIKTEYLEYRNIVNLIKIQNAWLTGNPDYLLLINQSKNLFPTDVNE